jgi:hypothetical protein
MWQKKIKKIKKINYRMAGVISIKIMEESAEESRKQRLYKKEDFHSKNGVGIWGWGNL